jgi:ribosome production factor 1
MKAACSDAKAIPPFSHVILECVLERARASVHEEHKDGASDMVKRKALSDGDTSSTKHIANRMKRQEVYQRIKKGKKDIKKAKKEQRKRDAEDPEKKDLPKQVPKTLDNMREADETIMLSEDEEIRNDEDEDEFARYFDGETPKTIITSCNHPSKTLIQFIRALLQMMPGSYYYERRNFDIKDIATWAGERGFTNLVIVGQGRQLGGHKKNPCELLLIHLPEGPSLHFKLTSVQMAEAIKVGGVKAGRATKHKPELILNGFTTRLGLRVSRAFTALFPQVLS